MSSDIVLAADLGASSGRLIAAELLENRILLHEVHRFENQPVRVGKRLHWDILGLWQHIERGLELAAQQYGSRIRSVGADTWGVDYVLLDKNDDLVGPAFCYRDSRTTGTMSQAFDRISRQNIFLNSGIQFMEINTLYQLWSMRLEGSPLLDIAQRFLMIPDFLHWQLSGVQANEYTNASTTQCLDPRTGNWSSKILESLQIPTHLFQKPEQPSTKLGKVLEPLRQKTGLHAGCEVILPATHDTGSAVIAVPANEFASEKPNWCYISSGTWSLMGVELAHPILSDKCQALNFTNEGGAEGSVRLLKNIAGLWPFQQLRASWKRRGRSYSWDDLTSLANSARSHQAFVDLDHASFVAPHDMLIAFEEQLKRSGQPLLDDAGLARTALESLAMKYRVCLHWLEDLLGYELETIHIVGGGVQNRLLCQMTADACNRPVIAGPVEATALGNVASQCVALGLFGSILEARQWMRSMPDIFHFEPREANQWNDAFARYKQVLS